ncbi:MAG: phosphotransferase family protein [Reyranella sp.]|uniref:phosphotransferase family protein n=1 Tax=Reyranella sp. TaxID=1929291 RepID=UPI0011FDC7D4|nr:phosphotransferase family protein [Reyranella sp.]TAJ85157.1 MAG: phosphotransferase family protein [Reyranella sp.]TBR29774.1 MAG: phosphotransferase family protein [Reyranella sp.]
MSVHTSPETETVTRVLGEAASRHFGGPVTIERLSRQSGGASRQTWSFDAIVNGTRQPLILRRDPPAQGKTERERAVAIDRATEFRVVRAAHDAGVRAPEPLFELTPQDGLGEAYVMRRVGGIAIARKLLRDAPYEAARGKIAGQLGEILARIHATDPATLPPLPRREAADHIAGLRRSLDALGRPQPVFELALSWLDRRKPAPLDRPVLVHGDYRTGNYLVDETGVTTILDWELAHLGDPVEDLGWLCVKSWRFGAIDKPAGGFGSREELWAAYERAGGGRVDPARAHWWEVFGTVHWGIICLNQAWKHLSGSIKSMEHASIGRRAVETEVDLLQLLKQGA